MVRIIDCVDELVEKCFGDQQLVELLEFTTNATKVTIKDQFLFHYESACYMGDKDSLIRALLYKTHLQQDLLLKIADYKRNLSRILELGEYSRVRLHYKEELGTETTIGVSGSNSTHDTKQADNYSGYDTNNNLNIADSRTGRSETNRVEELKTVIPQPSLAKNVDFVQTPKYDLQNRELNRVDEAHTPTYLNNPQYEDSDDKVGYQHLTKDLTTNQSVDSNVTNTSRGSSSASDGSTRAGHTNVKGNKSDVHDRTVDFITNDARVRLWSRELPRLKTKF